MKANPMQNKRRFKAIVHVELEYDIADKADEDNFGKDEDFSEISKTMIIDCLKYNADKIDFIEIKEIDIANSNTNEE